MSGLILPVHRVPASPWSKQCVQCISRVSSLPKPISRRAISNTLPRSKGPRRSARLPTTGTPSARTSQARPPPSPSKNVPPPIAAKVPSGPGHEPILDRLLQLGDQVLLYRAPNNHKSFTFLSITTAALMTTGAYQSVKLYFTDETPDGSKPLHPFIRLLGVVPALFLAFGGLVLFSAPSRLIRTITLIGPHVKGVNERSQPIVRCVSTIPLPFMKAQTFECSPGRIFASRTVSTVSNEKGFKWTSIDLADSERFSQSELAPAQQARKLSAPSLRNFWPTLKLQVRRMCLRDGFYNIRFPEGGSWKVDLQGAEVLENGHPLAAMMTYEGSGQQGLLGRLSAAFGRGAEAGASAARGRKRA